MEEIQDKMAEELASELIDRMDTLTEVQALTTAITNEITEWSKV